jgi:hypothetical protein
MRLQGDDVAAVRMWLDRRIIPPNPSNVVVGFDEGVGATFFDLNRLQVRPLLFGADLLYLVLGRALAAPC